MSTAVRAAAAKPGYEWSPNDLSLLSLLTSETSAPIGKTKRTPVSERRPPVDPLMLAAAAHASAESVPAPFPR